MAAEIICQIKDMGSRLVEIGQITALNYELIEMDGSSDEIIEGIIWHDNGSGKKSKIVREFASLFCCVLRLLTLSFVIQVILCS